MGWGLIWGQVLWIFGQGEVRLGREDVGMLGGFGLMDWGQDLVVGMGVGVDLRLGKSRVR